MFATKLDRRNHVMEEHSKQHKMKARKYEVKTKCQPLFTCDECELKVCQEDMHIEHVSTYYKCCFIKKESNIVELKPHGTFCLKCEKDFRSISMLKKHFAEKNTENHFTCDKCGVSYSSKYTLQNHISTEHEGTRITCKRPKCGMTFKCKDQYKTHILKHDGEAVFTCGECQRSFTTEIISSLILIHTRIVGSTCALNVESCFCTAMTYPSI